MRRTGKALVGHSKNQSLLPSRINETSIYGNGGRIRFMLHFCQFPVSSFWCVHSNLPDFRLTPPSQIQRDNVHMEACNAHRQLDKPSRISCARKGGHICSDASRTHGRGYSQELSTVSANASSDVCKIWEKIQVQRLVQPNE